MANRRQRAEQRLEALPLDQTLARHRSLEALSLMREKGLSLTQAVERAGTTRRTFLRHLSSTVTKTAGGRWQAKSSDRELRRVRWLMPTGLTSLWVRRSESSERVSRYWNAVDRYLKTSFTGDLDEFRGEIVQVAGVQHEFVVDPELIDRLAEAGQVSFPDIYALTD